MMRGGATKRTQGKGKLSIRYNSRWGSEAHLAAVDELEEDAPHAPQVGLGVVPEGIP